MCIERVDCANVTVSGDVSDEDIARSIDCIAMNYSKRVKIDGFRKGKVPLTLIKSRYGDSIRRDARQKCIDDLYSKAMRELDPSSIIGSPLVKTTDRENGFHVEFIIGMKPDFTLDGIESCVPSFTLPTVDDVAVENKIREYALARSPLVESSEPELREGLCARIDFDGFLDGVPFDGGKATGFDLVIGSGQFVPGFEDSIVGMKVGEERRIKVTFPHDYKTENLSGKECEFVVKLHKIMQREEVEIDDALAATLLGLEQSNDGSSTQNAGSLGALDSLRSKVRSDLELQEKLNLYNDGLKAKLLDSISKHVIFPLPKNIVEQEMNILFQSDLARLNQSELDQLRSDVGGLKNRYESHREKAELSVRMTFIVDKYAKREGIQVSDDEVLQTIYYEALVSNNDPKSLVAAYREKNLLPAVKMAMTEDKVLTHLLDSSCSKQS